MTPSVTIELKVTITFIVQGVIATFVDLAYVVFYLEN